MAINVQRISPIHEKLNFVHYFVRGVIDALIDVLGHFQSFCNHEIFVKLNLPMFVALMRQRERSEKCFNLFAFN